MFRLHWIARQMLTVENFTWFRSKMLYIRSKYMCGIDIFQMTSVAHVVHDIFLHHSIDRSTAMCIMKNVLLSIWIRLTLINAYAFHMENRWHLGDKKVSKFQSQIPFICENAISVACYIICNICHRFVLNWMEHTIVFCYLQNILTWTYSTWFFHETFKPKCIPWNWKTLI